MKAKKEHKGEYEIHTDNHGTKYWYKHGRLHREDGLGVEYPDGHGYYYLKGKVIEEGDWKRAVLRIKISAVLHKGTKGTKASKDSPPVSPKTPMGSSPGGLPLQKGRITPEHGRESPGHGPHFF